MAKNLNLSIVVGLKDRASKGLQNIGVKVKGMGSGIASSAGGFRATIGGWLSSMHQFEERVRPWVARLRKVLLSIWVPGAFKIFIGPVVNGITRLEKKLASFRMGLLDRIFPGAAGEKTQAPGGAGGEPGAGGAAGGAESRARRVFNLRGPLAILNAGLNLAISGLRMIGSLALTVFRGLGKAITVAANIGIAALKGLFSIFQRLVGIASHLALVLGVVATAAAGMTALVAKSSLDAAMMMEGFLAKLTTAVKNPALGKQWMDWATKMAAQTPFEVSEVVDAATRLLLQRFNPAALITDIGNMAGAMNKPITDAVEAYLDGLRGEWERLKEFGITGANLIQFGAKQAPMGGIETRTIEGATRAKKALDALLKSRYGGGMAQMMKTAAGQVSNFKDQVFALRVTIGNLLLPVFKQAVTFGQEFASWLASMKVGERIGTWMARVGARILWIGRAIAFVIQQVAGGRSLGDVIREVLVAGFGKGVAAQIGPAITNLIGSLQRLWVAVSIVFANLTGGFRIDPATAIRGIVDRVAAVVDWLTKHVFAPGRVEGIAKWFGHLRRMVLTTVAVVVAGIQYGIAKLGGVERIVQTVGGYLRWLADWGKYLAGWVYTHLPQMVEVFGSVFGKIAEIAVWLGGVLNDVFLKILQGLAWVIHGFNNVPGIKLDKAEAALANAVALGEQFAGALRVAATQVAKIEPWSQGAAAGIRAGQQRLGFTAPAMPPTSPAGYLPPQVTNNVYITGQGDVYLKQQLEQALRDLQREQRWAPAG